MRIHKLLHVVVVSLGTLSYAGPVLVHPVLDLSSPVADSQEGGIWGYKVELGDIHSLYVNHLYPESDLGDSPQNTVFLIAPQTGFVLSSITSSAGNVPAFRHDFATTSDGAVFVSSLLGADPTSYEGSINRFEDAYADESVSFFPNDVLDYYYYGSSVDASDQLLVVSAGHVYSPDGTFNARGTLLIQDQMSGEELARLSPEHLPDYASFGDRGGFVIHEDKLLVVALGSIAPGGKEIPREMFMFDLSNPSMPTLLWQIPESERTDAAFGLQTLALNEEYAFVARSTREASDSQSRVYIQVHDVLTGDDVRTIELDQVEEPRTIHAPSVATYRDMLVVGNPLAELDSRVSVYRISTGELVYQLRPGDLIEWEVFGHSVDVVWPRIVVSAPHVVEDIDGAGSVFVYNLLDESVCFADVNQDGELTFFDVSEFIEAFIAGDSRADIDFTGDLSFFDLTYFLQNYNAGCP